MSRRAALGWLGGLAVLMGVPSAKDVLDIKPEDDRWDDIDTSTLYCNTSIDNPTTAADIMKMVDKFRDLVECEDLTDHIHVMDPNRMTGLGGYTVLARCDNEHKQMPQVVTRPMS